MSKRTRITEGRAREVPGKDRTLTFTFSTEQIARDGDIVRTKGWDTEAFERNPVVLWGHNPNLPPIGRVTETRKIVHGDSKRLEGDIEFAGLEQMHDLAETVYSLARDGFLRTTSVGFMPKKDRKLDEDERAEMGLAGGGREWIEQELYEVSIVSVPADTGALIQAAAERPEVRDAVLAVRAALPEEERGEWPGGCPQCGGRSESFGSECMGCLHPIGTVSGITLGDVNQTWAASIREDRGWCNAVIARLEVLEAENAARKDRGVEVRECSCESERSERGSPNLGTAKAPDAKQTEDRWKRLDKWFEERIAK